MEQKLKEQQHHESVVLQQKVSASKNINLIGLAQEMHYDSTSLLSTIYVA